MTPQEQLNLNQYRFRKALSQTNPSEEFIKGAEWALEWLRTVNTGYHYHQVRYPKSDSALKIGYVTDIEPLNNDEL